MILLSLLLIGWALFGRLPSFLRPPKPCFPDWNKARVKRLNTIMSLLRESV